MRHLSTDLRRRDRHYHNHHNHRYNRHALNDYQRNSFESDEEDLFYSPSQRQQRRFRHPHLPLLFYAVQNRNWAEVVRRATSHPHEILTYEDLSGNTPLHIACRLDPTSDVIKSLLMAKNEVNKEGATPLHIASSSRCSKEVILALISEENEDEEWCCYKKDTNGGGGAMALTKMGRAPIHYACMSFRGLGVDAFQVLLEATIRAGEDYDVDMEEEEDCDEDRKMPAKPTQHKRTNKSGEGGKKNQKTKKKRGILSRWKNFNSNHEEEERNETSDDVISDEDSSCDTDIEDYYFDDDSQTSSIDNNKSIYEGNPVTLRDVTGQTPLGLLFRRYRERVRFVIKMVENSYLRGRNGHNNANNNENDDTGNGNDTDNTATNNDATAAAQAVQADLGELWEKSRLIVGAMAEQQQRHRQKNHKNGTQLLSSSFVSLEEEDEEDLIALEAAAWAARRFRRRASCDYEKYSNELDDGVDRNYYQGKALEEEKASGLGNHDDFFYHSFGEHNKNNSDGNGEGEDSKHKEKNKCHHREFRIVHASVGLTGYGCPPEMLRLALSVHPEQAREMDEDGNLPLHIAAVARAAASSPEEDVIGDDDGNSSCAGKFGLEVLMEDTASTSTSLGTALLATTTTTASTVLSSDDLSLNSEASSLFQPYTSSTKSFDKVIKILLRHYPESAQIPHGRTGRLPLMLAIESGRRTWHDGIKALLESYPAALESRVLEPKLYPSILSMIGGGGGGTGINRSHGTITTIGERAEFVDAEESVAESSSNCNGQRRWWGVRVLRRGNGVGSNNGNRRRVVDDDGNDVGPGSKRCVVDGKLDPLFNLLKARPQVVSDAM
uniref:Uncharacterized protein n=1 Tax=Helicotheca tamesis TaxID=374047 RepID=A0A7S2MX27_9STRA|mmetsp:Transcript_4928/g.6785  ORF Transcript_4928/g.6785 Transcript_4928/m.6785 type:complete len:836 (+) Transcript_4928:247-2754(+)